MKGPKKKKSWIDTDFNGPEGQTSVYPNKSSSQTSHLARDHLEPHAVDSRISSKSPCWRQKLIRSIWRRNRQKNPIREEPSMTKQPPSKTTEDKYNGGSETPPPPKKKARALNSLNTTTLQCGGCRRLFRCNTGLIWHRRQSWWVPQCSQASSAIEGENNNNISQISLSSCTSIH